MFKLLIVIILSFFWVDNYFTSTWYLIATGPLKEQVSIPMKSAQACENFVNNTAKYGDKDFLYEREHKLYRVLNHSYCVNTVTGEVKG